MMTLNDDEDPIMLFTMDHEYKIAMEQVTSFQNPLIAKSFIEKFVPQDEYDDYMILLMDKKKPLKPDVATYKEVLANGYHQWAGYMIDTLPMVSNRIH